jgi:hypothetical protein
VDDGKIKVFIAKEYLLDQIKEVVVHQESHPRGKIAIKIS